MKLCMSFIRDLLNAGILEMNDPNHRLDDFDLEGWKYCTDPRIGKEMLVLGTAQTLTKARLTPDMAVICAGRAPDLLVERLLAVDMDLETMAARVDNIFRTFETFEYRVKTSDPTESRLTVMLRQILEDRIVSRRSIREEVRRIGWDPEGPFLCICIQTGSNSLQDELPVYYTRLVAGEIKGSCVFPYQNQIICVADLSRYDRSPGAFMGTYVEFLRDNMFRAGVSNPFTDLLELKDFRKQAQIALQIGNATAPSIWYHRFADRVPDYLLAQCTAELSRTHVCAPELLTLKKLDQDNDSDYYNTLKAYLKNSLNAVQTARELYVHRGTMNYRLKRIREITGLDPEDPDTRLYLEISFRLLERE